jgi:hypothetical protein
LIALAPDHAALLNLQPVALATQMLVDVIEFIAQAATLIIRLRFLQPLFALAAVVLKAVDTATRPVNLASVAARFQKAWCQMWRTYIVVGVSGTPRAQTIRRRTE